MKFIARIFNENFHSFLDEQSVINMFEFDAPLELMRPQFVNDAEPTNKFLYDLFVGHGLIQSMKYESLFFDIDGDYGNDLSHYVTCDIMGSDDNQILIARIDVKLNNIGK